MEVHTLEEQLNNFDPEARKAALCALAAGTPEVECWKPEVNIHFHSFFSFNAEGWSPSRIAWEAGKYGLEVAGIVDFDVLDGVDEFLEAGELLGLKATAGLESRVFVKEYADQVLNSPNEPGVYYFMAQGCPSGAGPWPDEFAQTILRLRRIAQQRNTGVMERVNEYRAESGSITCKTSCRSPLPAMQPSGICCLLTTERAGICLGCSAGVLGRRARGVGRRVPRADGGHAYLPRKAALEADEVRRGGLRSTRRRKLPGGR